jgi:hypothetical protein
MKTMDVKTFCAQLQEGMKSKLEGVARDNKEITARVAKSQAIIKSSIIELKAFVCQCRFQNKSEEIEFFKVAKPVIVSQYYYYEKLLELKMNEPSGELSVIKEYYYSELNRLQEYLVGHKEFYAYCLSGSTELDELYFLSRPGTFLSPDSDTRFSTGYDGILAQILANQLIREYVEAIIKNLSSDPGTTSPLTWTTKKAYLVELIYALHGVKAINDGKAEIKQIASLFENLFNVSLGNFYRHFTEIGIRKTGRTNFIDQLKEKLEKRLDELM